MQKKIGKIKDTIWIEKTYIVYRPTNEGNAWKDISQWSWRNIRANKIAIQDSKRKEEKP